MFWAVVFVFSVTENGNVQPALYEAASGKFRATKKVTFKQFRQGKKSYKICKNRDLQYTLGAGIGLAQTEVVDWALGAHVALGCYDRTEE